MSVPASPGVIFQTGNQQFTNVNIAADTDALSIIGDIGNTGLQMTFDTMIGPDGTTQVTMHGQHGVAFVQSFADSQPGATDTGFASITLTAQAGYGFTGGDFELDQLNQLPSPTGILSLQGIDQFSGVSTNNTLGISENGQNPYNFYTTGREVATSIVITVATSDLLEDIKQVSLN